MVDGVAMSSSLTPAELRRPESILGSLADTRSALENLRYQLTIAKLGIAADLRDSLPDALRGVERAVAELRPRARRLVEVLGADPGGRRTLVRTTLAASPALVVEAERELAEIERLEDEVREQAHLTARLGRQAATEVSATLHALGATAPRAETYTAQGSATLADHGPARLDRAV